MNNKFIIGGTAALALILSIIGLLVGGNQSVQQVPVYTPPPVGTVSNTQNGLGLTNALVINNWAFDSRNQKAVDATTTPCSFLTPNVPTALNSFAAYFSLTNQIAQGFTIVLATSTLPNATTSVIYRFNGGKTTSTTTEAYLIASSTSVANDIQARPTFNYYLPANTWVNIGLEGPQIGQGTGAGTSTVFSGQCQLNLQGFYSY